MSIWQGPRGLERATAFAPASVGNVGIGFDILGFAVDAPHYITFVIMLRKSCNYYLELII